MGRIGYGELRCLRINKRLEVSVPHTCFGGSGVRLIHDRAFDHVAHLSGAFFGLVYYQFGRQAWDWTRRKLGGRERGIAAL